MSPASATGEYAGWFGKIPSLGDFATRRLPPGFVGRWDEWLSGELSEARSLLGDTWLVTYQQAPVSCFSLGVGVVDDRAWLGILVPSFDRVGRQFPLTIAMSRPPDAAMRATREWWAELVEVGQRALEPGCGADGVDAALSAFTAAQAKVGSDVTEAERSAAGVASAPTEVAGSGAGLAGSAGGVADAERSAMGATHSGAGPCGVGIVGEGKSAWLTWAATGPVDAACEIVDGLPRGVGFRKLLGGG